MAIEDQMAGNVLAKRLAAAVKRSRPVIAIVEGYKYPLEVTAADVGFDSDIDMKLTTTDGIWFVRKSHLIAIRLPQ